MKVHLLDGAGFVFRAYHALPKLQRKDGTEVGAVRGFVEMLWRATRQMDATHVAVIFDAGRSGRCEIYEGYKANRPPLPEDLTAQLAMVDEACEAFGVAARRVRGYEADDVIATLAVQAEDHHVAACTTIHSSDKDFYQLMTPNIKIYDPIKKAPMGPQDCIKRFGVMPHQVVCAQSMIGDKVDNVPGVMWVGEKAAAALLREYEDLDGVIEAIRSGPVPGLNKKQIASFLGTDAAGRTGIELARLSRKLVTLQVEVPLDFSFDDIVKREPDEEVLTAWLAKMEFEGLASKIDMQAA